MKANITKLTSLAAGFFLELLDMDDWLYFAGFVLTLIFIMFLIFAFWFKDEDKSLQTLIVLAVVFVCIYFQYWILVLVILFIVICFLCSFIISSKSFSFSANNDGIQFIVADKNQRQSLLYRD